MKSVSGKRMCKILEARGWRRYAVSSSHYLYERDNFPLKIAVPVHGNRDIATGTLRTIMRQAGLTAADL